MAATGQIRTGANGKREMWDPESGEGGAWIPEVFDPTAGEGGAYVFKTAAYQREHAPAPDPAPTTDPTTDPAPVVDPPVSYDPPAGGPSYTPGIVFGQGQLPGVGANGQPYQRQWFDVGPDAQSESNNNILYNTDSNWGLAWDKVVNQFGGMPGGDFNKWLTQFGGKARNDFQNTVPYVIGADGQRGVLNVSDFLDQYAPQVKGVYDLLPGTFKGRGGAMPLAGRANY